MVETEPKPPWPTNPFVASFAVDQCNIWQAAKQTHKGRFRGSERLDTNGMPTFIRSETILNGVQRHIPFAMSMLTPGELQHIRDQGPYTEDYRNVLPHIDPTNVRRQLYEGFVEITQLVGTVQLRSESSVTDALLEKPPADVGGRTEMSFLPSIPDCDTKYHKDVFKFIPILLSYCCSMLAVLVVFGDGQTVEILRACKRRWPDDYKRVLIGNGYFHAFAHFMFALIQGFWKVLHAKPGAAWRIAYGFAFAPLYSVAWLRSLSGCTRTSRCTRR
jgi:hypothetical protein